METLDDDLQDDKVYFNKPSLMLRVKSMLIDTMTFVALMMLMSVILGKIEIVSDNTRMICLGLAVLYEPIFISLGGTIGQRIMGLRVRNSTHFKQDGSRHNINFIYSLIRYVAKIFLGWISLLTIHSSDYGQAIHDKVGNSIMTFKEI